MKRIIPVLLFFMLIPLTNALEIKTGEEGDLIIYLKDANGDPVIGATCTIDIYFPNNTIALNDGLMTDLSNGFYNYTYTAPTTTGDYKVIANCSYGGVRRTTARLFSVVNTTTKENIKSIKQTSEETYSLTDTVRSIVKDIKDIVTEIRGAMDLIPLKIPVFEVVLIVFIIIGVLLVIILYRSGIGLTIRKKIKRRGE